MYFRNVLCTVAFATLASAAVAKQIPTPYSSEGFDDEVFERDAEADPARTAAWEEAHGGIAPSYHYGEEHDASAWHVARNAEPMAEAEAHIKNKAANWASWLSSALPSGVKKAIPTVKPLAYKGGLKKPRVRKGPHKNKYYNPKHARDVESDDDSEFGDGDFEDFEDFEDLQARDIDIEIPDFGDQEVDTSLEGLLEARDVGFEEGEEGYDNFEDFEEDDSKLAARDVGGNEEDDHEEPVDESKEDFSGYDEEILQRRSEGTDNDIDYSLEGYDTSIDDEDTEAIYTRDVEEDDQHFEDDVEVGEDSDELFARGANDDEETLDFGDEEVDTSLEGLLEARDVEGGAEEGDFSDDDYADPFLDYGDDDGLSARDVDDETLEDADDIDNDADAAYADAEVVEELEAPAVEERDVPTETEGKPASSSRGFWEIVKPW